MKAIKPVLDFVAAYWMSLISGVVALLAIGALAFGLTRNTVIAEMQRHKAAANEIGSLQSGVKNKAEIDAEIERGRKSQEQINATREVAKQINRREPLIAGVFPKASQMEPLFRFQEAYRAWAYGLPRELMGAGPPTAQEAQDEFDRLVEEERQKGGPTPESAPAREPNDRGQASPPGQPGGAQSGVTMNDAAAQAAIRKARNIRMYVEAVGPRGAFHISPVWQTDQAPREEDLWYAQVGVWIQNDVVRAIREVNDEAAQKLDPKDAHVGNMPIKHLLAVRVAGYNSTPPIKFDAASAGGSSGLHGVALPADVKTSFTGRACDAQFDVVRFSVAMIMDQRDLLKFADRITRMNFYQLVGLDYVAAPSTLSTAEGAFYYGDSPVVRATFDFEGFMARDVYLATMPVEVQTKLGAQKKP